MKPYYPSNSCEGDGFLNMYCMQCAHHDPDDSRASKNCEIFINSLSAPVPQWIYNPDPTCTEFKHHDWSQGEPEVVDPNQLELFTEAHEHEFVDKFGVYECQICGTEYEPLNN